MKHDDAFLLAILESPDDDTPRLVYSDWLEEHGQSDRAEFVRVQVALAGLPPDDQRQKELEAKERQLLEENREEWLGPLRGVVEKAEFRWGFVESGAASVEPSGKQSPSSERPPLLRLPNPLHDHVGGVLPAEGGSGGVRGRAAPLTCGSARGRRDTSGR
jgi:uncharacterized protein (TIGR02996 family)